MPHLLTLGHGYCAEALAGLLTPEGWIVTGTTRRPEKADLLADAGVRPLVLPEDWSVADLPCADATHLLISTAPDSHGCPVLRRLGSRLDVFPNLQWIGLLSTIGVYGERHGNWVREGDARDGTLPRGQARVVQEDGWRAAGTGDGIAVQIFRLAGIYGPGRSALEATSKRNRRRIVKPGHVFNRIHVADVAEIVRAGIAHPNSGPDFNCADDLPAPPGVPIAYAARLQGREPPPEVPYEQADLSEMGRSFYAECKRIDNSRVKTALQVRLRFPTYRDGLSSLAGISPPPGDPEWSGAEAPPKPD